MPQLMWLYLTVLLYDRTTATCVAMEEALQTVSHDRLTRMLQADWSGPILLERACRMRFVWEQGYLVLDDTVIPQPLATAMESLVWVFSSQERRPVYGFSLVLLVWTEGTRRLPSPWAATPPTQPLPPATPNCSGIYRLPPPSVAVLPAAGGGFRAGM
jgi:hypothetical protein